MNHRIWTRRPSRFHRSTRGLTAGLVVCGLWMGGGVDPATAQVGSYFGSVSDACTDVPIAGASLTAVPDPQLDPPITARDESHPDGKYLLDVVPMPQIRYWRIRVRARGYHAVEVRRVEPPPDNSFHQVDFDLVPSSTRVQVDRDRYRPRWRIYAGRQATRGYRGTNLSLVTSIGTRFLPTPPQALDARAARTRATPRTPTTRRRTPRTPTASSRSREVTARIRRYSPVVTGSTPEACHRGILWIDVNPGVAAPAGLYEIQLRTATSRLPMPVDTLEVLPAPR